MPRAPGTVVDRISLGRERDTEKSGELAQDRKKDVPPEEL